MESELIINNFYEAKVDQFQFLAGDLSPNRYQRRLKKAENSIVHEFVKPKEILKPNEIEIGSPETNSPNILKATVSSPH